VEDSQMALHNQEVEVPLEEAVLDYMEMVDNSDLLLLDSFWEVVGPSY